LANIADLNVILELQRRNDFGSGDALINRIPLFVTEITIATNKTVPNIGVPFSGAVRGESTNLAFDMGLSQKTLSIQGVLLEQSIKKQTDKETERDVTMTAFEIAQLLHSYVDASSFQDDQNINKILIFYPSRVDNSFNQRLVDIDGNAVTAEAMKTLDINKVPLIPFNWKNRAFDNSFTAFSGNTTEYPSTIFDIITKSKNHMGVTGFIRSFSATISGEAFPTINFSMEFEEAKVIADNFFD
tara:strand:- start:1973 stop:2701 length:729 start_codon:yes stop_codon:yes gene_type:complete